jgi:hypothetical protein
LGHQQVKSIRYDNTTPSLKYHNTYLSMKQGQIQIQIYGTSNK